MSITLDGSNLTTTGVINSGTAVATTSGTSFDFTGIPSGTKRITLMLNGVSTNSTSFYILRLGTSSGIVSTGYVNNLNVLYSSIQIFSSTTCFQVMAPTAIDTHGGQVVISNLGSNNTWVVSGIVCGSNAVACTTSGYSPNLGGTLDRIRFTTVNGTDTFDAGSINILYE